MLSGGIKRGVVIFLNILFLILLSSPYIVYAFGIATPYIESDTLKLGPGEEYAYSFTIQNGEDQDYSVIIDYDDPAGIAEISDTYKVIPKQTYDTKFEILISVPRNAPIGTKYSISYGARPQINDSSAVSMGVEIRRGINIEVVDKEVPEKQESDVPDRKKPTTRDSSKVTKNPFLTTILLIIISIVAIVLIWKTSRKISARMSKTTRTDYTISQAMNLEEVKILLEKMSDEEFNVPEIKNIFKEKITELSSGRAAREIHHLTRKEFIKAIDKYSKEKR